MKILNFDIPNELIKQFFKYGLIGIVNTILTALIFNLLIYATGISTGWPVIGFSAITFAVVIFQSFLLNKKWVFKVNGGSTHKMFVNFFLVSVVVALVNLGVVHLIVNVIGAPSWISTHAWANVAIVFTIFVSVAGNFTGYKLIVFRERAHQSQV